MFKNEFKLIGPRRCGKTTAICKAAKEIGATVICESQQHAEMVKKEHGVRTTHIDKEARGTKGPYIYDDFAVTKMCFKYESDNADLLDENAKLQNENTRLREELEEAKKEITILRQYGNKICTAMADEVLAKQPTEKAE